MTTGNELLVDAHFNGEADTGEESLEDGRAWLAERLPYSSATTIMQKYINLLYGAFLSQCMGDEPTLDDVPEQARDIAAAHWTIAKAAIMAGRGVFQAGCDFINQNKDRLAAVEDDDFLYFEAEFWDEMRYSMQAALWDNSSGLCGDHRPAIFRSFSEAVRCAHIYSASLVPDAYRSFQRLAPLLRDAANGDERAAQIFVEGALRYVRSLNNVAKPSPKKLRRGNDSDTNKSSSETERVGPAWLHQLVVFLLHLCQTDVLKLTPAIVELASTASTAPNSGAKSAKASRFLEMLQNQKTPLFAHEASVTALVAKRLSWELLGWADANRQLSYMRHVERAVAFCRNRYAISGELPNPNEVAKKSGLKWDDADNLLNSYVLTYEVDEYEVRLERASRLAQECPECQQLSERIDLSDYMKNGSRFPSSVD
ncbi:MAG TPA: hypothetical protein VD995_04740 [Azospirillum sp.]|nr:hypothetical protein [Azospirillum sp.]